MGAPNLLVKRALPLGVIHVEVLGAKTSTALSQYEKIKITKTGYLWGYLRLVLMEGVSQKLVKENLGYIDKGYKIVSISEDLIVLKKPKQIKLADEFIKNKQSGKWEAVKN